MTRSALPPQAYTKEILAQAYDWFKDQPPSIRELASNADSLVSLYLQSRRRRDGSVSKQSNPNEAAPVSSVSFKNELKNLAKGLERFENATPQQINTAMTPSQAFRSEPISSSSVSGTYGSNLNANSNPISNLTKAEESQLKESLAEVKAKVQENIETSTKSSAKTGSKELDPISRDLIYQVKKALNMAHDDEVIRMLITLGYEKIKEIFPNR